MLLGDIPRRNAKRYPKKTAIIFRNSRYTFREFNDRVNQMANALLDMGMRKNDKIAVLADSCPQYVEAYFATAKSGTILVPLNNLLSPRELSHIINDSEANTLVLGENYLKTAESIQADLGGVKHFITLGTPTGEMVGYEQLLSSHPADEPEVDIEENDVVYFMYTSGTTGLPKAVMVTHRSALATALSYILLYHATHHDIALIPFQTSSTGVSYSIILPYSYMGCTLVIAEDSEPKTILELIETAKVTTSFMTPPIILSLVEHPERDRYDHSSLRLVSFGGGFVEVGTLKRAIKAFGSIFGHLYGLTEVTPITYFYPEEMILDGTEAEVKRLKSCGREAVNSDVRIVDDNGRDVPLGQVGEVICGGEQVMKGYWKLPQVTDQAIRGGYFYTGDLATIDEDGYIYLLGRKKESITSRGKTIYPREIEDVIYHHPSVLEVAVIGIPDEELGDLIKAVVVPRAGESVTEGELIELCRRNLADYAVPRSVAFIDRLPRNVTGKILNRVLREKYSSG